MSRPRRDATEPARTLPLEPDDEAKLWVMRPWRSVWRSVLILGLMSGSGPIVYALLPTDPNCSTPAMEKFLLFFPSGPMLAYVLLKYVQNQLCVRSLERRGYAVPKSLGGSSDD